jgi:hypothetical protein
MSADKLSDAFKKFIALIEQTSSREDSLSIMTLLFELADQQWQTYTLLSEDIRLDLDDCILKVWQPDSLDSTEKLFGIISRLGLKKAYAHLNALDLEMLPPTVSNEVKSAIEEFGDDVSNPYSGMNI